MATVHGGRFSADLEGEFVVFLIGMSVNKPWKLHKWVPVARAMAPMLRVLSQRKDLGLLGYTLWVGARGPLLVQYWRSFEQLERFARDPSLPHHAPWRAYNQRVAADGDVGVWHETYQVGPGRFESIYANMPVFGLARAGRHVPVARRGDRAAQRLRHEASPTS